MLLQMRPIFTSKYVIEFFLKYGSKKFFFFENVQLKTQVLEWL